MSEAEPSMGTGDGLYRHDTSASNSATPTRDTDFLIMRPSALILLFERYGVSPGASVGATTLQREGNADNAPHNAGLPWNR